MKKLSRRSIVPRICLAITVIVGLFSCDALGEIRHLDLGDVTPPQLGSHCIQDSGMIVLEFDEQVALRKNSLRLNSSDSAIQVQPVEKPDSNGYSRNLTLEIAGDSIPGKLYNLELAVEDAHQNSLNIIMPFYGPNRNPARLLINEVLTGVSSKNRDTVELYAQTSGNIGGITLFWGIPGNFDYAYSLPALVVNRGDYILIHCKPEGTSEEKNELAGMLDSGGKNSSPFARDFWVTEAPGLPDSTGIISIADNPLGIISDALFYSDKVTVAGKDYRSFGTKKLLDRAEGLQAAKAWKCSGERITVEDAAQTGGITATRSLNRSSSHADTNDREDWHIVPSGQISLGSNNIDTVYVKP